jgi:protoheme IX farnesyltransferase
VRSILVATPNALTTSVPSVLLARLSAYWQLSKPRLALLVWLSALASMWLPQVMVPASVLVAFAAGVWLVIASANGWNQVLEWRHDVRMRRTATRPIPSGKISARDAAIVSTLWGVVGILVLWFAVNPFTALLGAFALLMYVFVYTPMKRVSPWCTVVGAVAGAIPPAAGWTAAAGSLNWQAVLLFTVQFLWQFPHFWAIAWKYRQEYHEAGFHMVPFHDDEGFVVGKMMWLLSLALLAVSLIPFLTGWRSGFYAAGALLLGLWLTRSVQSFMHQPDGKRAMKVTFTSLGYLPLWLLLLILVY